MSAQNIFLIYILYNTKYIFPYVLLYKLQHTVLLVVFDAIPFGGFYVISILMYRVYGLVYLHMIIDIIFFIYCIYIVAKKRAFNVMLISAFIIICNIILNICVLEYTKTMMVQ